MECVYTLYIKKQINICTYYHYYSTVVVVVIVLNHMIVSMVLPVSPDVFFDLSAIWSPIMTNNKSHCVL